MQQSTNTCTFVEQSTTFVDHKHKYKKTIWFPLADKAKRRLYHHIKASLSMHRNESVVCSMYGMVQVLKRWLIITGREVILHSEYQCDYEKARQIYCTLYKLHIYMYMF